MHKHVVSAKVSGPCVFRAGESFASDRNILNYRTVIASMLNEICADRPGAHIECNGQSHHFCAKCDHNHESSIEADYESCEK